MAATHIRRVVKTPTGYVDAAILGLTDDGWADSEVERLALAAPDLLRVPRDAREPSPFDGPGTKARMEREFPFEVHDTGTVADGNLTSDVDAEVARYVAEHKKQFSPHEDHSKEISGSISPKSLAVRNAAERRELAAGRRQNPITR